jgi:hypothetical protein
MSDEGEQPANASEPSEASTAGDAPAEPARQLTFMERARQVAGQAATTAARVGVDVGTQAAKAGADLGGKAAKAGAEMGGKAVTTIRDPATRVKAQSALKKAKRGFTTALERIDPRILADVVVKATSLQERANLSLLERGSVYRIGEISIGASIPPSIHFAIVRVEDPDNRLADSRTLLATAGTGDAAVAPTAETIVSLDGTAVHETELDELEDEE